MHQVLIVLADPVYNLTCAFSMLLLYSSSQRVSALEDLMSPVFLYVCLAVIQLSRYGTFDELWIIFLVCYTYRKCFNHLKDLN